MGRQRRGPVGRGRSKEARIIAAAVVAAGGEITRTGQGHLRITGPTGVAFVSSAPGSNRMGAVVRTIEQHAGLKISISG